MYARDEALIATPIGTIRLRGGEHMLESIRIEDDETAVSRGTARAVRAAADQLLQWFAAERRDFDLPLEPAATARGGVLRQGMVNISFGKTESYGTLARRVDSAARAIGQACARNPFPIVVPCHRVIGSGGALGHYSAGAGVATKRWLLEFERKVLGVDLL
ncbi:MAG TPA: methylated-DNA--[protein]-cysteine S-methyltransferase [Sphingomonas sp.]|nr:methylated-DNA--[protein]-cysteine S-methyltransferase [Sphingomonas sp.]